MIRASGDNSRMQNCCVCAQGA